ncbi:caspase domain-containing protein [Streptomyces sp. NPDC059340]|uniref:caspase family protein n=1 Tax=Streptomyces sp. NPDC059340 TaxID=3346806 RepID=UPI00367F5FF3
MSDYSRSRAVLIGVSNYTQLPPVPPARNSLNRMTGLLTGPLCGWPKQRVEVLHNPRRLDRLPDQLMNLFDGVVDVALFYFVGHAHVHDDELFLALGEAPEAGPRLAPLGLPFSDVRAALRACDAKTKIVILDCCFSGRATLAGHRPAAVIDMTLGTGAFTMATSAASWTTWSETEPNTAEPQTYFTKYLIDTIERGLPEHLGGLPLGTVFAQTADAMARDRLPMPTRSVRYDADRFILARNAAEPTADQPRERNTPPLDAPTALSPGPPPPRVHSQRHRALPLAEPAAFLVLLAALLVCLVQVNVTALGMWSFFAAALPWAVFVLGFTVLGWQVRVTVRQRSAQYGTPGWRRFTRSFAPPARWSPEERAARRAAAERAIDEACLRVDQQLASMAPREDGESDA